MAIPNQIVIDSPTNTVEVQTNDNQLTIISEVCNTEVTVTQPTVTTIQVATPGPKGDKGDTGDAGTAITNQITTGSITASVNVGTNTFRVQSGSSTYFYISSSGNVGINTTTPTLGLLQLNSSNAILNPSLYINAATLGSTASIVVRSNNGTGAAAKTYNPVGGSDSLNFIQLLDGDITSTTDQPIGRIIFSSNDADSGGTNATKAFIEAVSEDATPDTFLAFGTAQASTSVTERMRITSVGNVGIGTTSPTNTLQVNGGITATYLTASYIDINTTAGITQPIEGRLSWDNTDGTLDIGLKGGNITLQVGQKQVARVVNKTGGDLLKSEYKVVRIRRTDEGGAQGQRLAIKLPQANNDPNSVDTLGLVAENINDNQEGYIITSGLVYNINTTGDLQSETWYDGDVLYLSPTVAGALTNIKPIAPNHTVIVGFVVYAHNNQGKIFVKVDNGYEIDELHNVRINTSSLAVGDLLIYSSSVWINSKQMTGSYSLTGSLNVTSGITGSLFGTSSTTTGVAPAITGNTNNRVLTATGGGTINGEANLIFDGGTLGVVGDVSVDGNVTAVNTVDTTNLSVNGYVTTNLSPTDVTYNLTLGESSRTWNQVHVGTSDKTKTAFFGEDLLNNPGKIAIRTDNDLTIRAQQGIDIIGTTIIATLQNDTLTNNVSISTPSLTATNLRATNSASIGGNFSPTARLHISGANNDALFRASSPTTTGLFVSGSGRVGIGTTNPRAALHISAGDISLDGTRYLDWANGDNRIIGGAAGGYSLQFHTWTGTALTEKMRISGSGEVGIGTTNPQRRLHIDASGSVNTNVPLLLTSVDTNNRVGILFASSSLSAGRQHNLFHRVNAPNVEWLLGTNAGETAQWNFIPRDDTNYAITLRTPFNGGTTQITTGLSQSLFSLGAGGTGNQHLNISSSGRVGVGTTTPRELFSVGGGNIALDSTRYIDFGSGNSRISDLGQISGQGYPITISTFGPIADGASNNLTEKLRLTGSGSLGLGTTNPLARLHISGSDGNDFLRVTSGSQNILNVRSGSVVWFAGTGVAPSSGVDWDIQGTGTVNGGSVRFAGNGTAWAFGSVSSVNRGSTGNSDMFNVSMGGTGTVNQNPMSITFNANQSTTGGGGYTVLRVNATHATTAGTGSKLLQTWEFGGVQRSVVNITGSIGVGITTPSASVHISSSLGLPPMLTITPHDPLPTTNIPTGTFMVSASVPPKPFFWDGTTWNALY